MYSREEIKALTDTVLNMAKADGVEVEFRQLLDRPAALQRPVRGQPTQTNSISHGSPYLRIKKILVGAAYA